MESRQEACCPATLLHQSMAAVRTWHGWRRCMRAASPQCRALQLYDIEVPQELFEQIERQQQLCVKFIAAKQALIRGGCRAGGVLCLEPPGSEQRASWGAGELEGGALAAHAPAPMRPRPCRRPPGGAARQGR